MAWMARAATAVVVAMSGAGCMSLVARNPFPDLPPERVNAEIPPEQLRDDLKAYFELIERTAPNPYLFVPREQVEARVVSVSAAIDRPLTRRTFMPYLREVMAAYRIGHHYALDPKEEFNAWTAAGGRPFPLKVRIEGDEVVIDSDEQPELKGALLRSINGAEAAEILARLRGATSSATDAYRDMTIARASISGSGSWVSSRRMRSRPKPLRVHRSLARCLGRTASPSARCSIACSIQEAAIRQGPRRALLRRARTARSACSRAASDFSAGTPCR